MNVCRKCGIEKEDSEFHIARGNTKGISNTCKKCLSTAKPKEKLPDGFKRCCKCKEVKKVTEFHKHKQSKDGLKGECKKCRSRNKNEEDKNFLYEVLPEGMRRCRKCNLIKEIGEFRRRRRVCWDCLKQNSNDYYHSHKTHCSERFKIYLGMHRDRINTHKREYMRKHIKTEAGKLVDKRHRDKRRNLGWEPINKWFEGSVGHHLRYTNDINSQNNNIGIYAPLELHKSISHNGNTGKNMAEINKLLLEWYLNNTPSEERNKQAVQLYWNYCTKPEPVWSGD